MKKGKSDSMSVVRLRFMHILLALVVLCLITMSIEAPRLFKPRSVSLSRPPLLEVLDDSLENRDHQHELFLKFAKPKENHHFIDKVQFSASDNILKKYVKQDREAKEHQGRLLRRSSKQQREFSRKQQSDAQKDGFKNRISGSRSSSVKGQKALSDMERAIDEAWLAGAEALKEAETALKLGNLSMATSSNKHIKVTDDCPRVVLMSSQQMQKAGYKMIFPCGLMSGSAVTVIGKPKAAHVEYMPHIARVVEGTPNVLVSQFTLELQGLTVVDNEDPPRILHVNPRLEGDWSEKPVIELNTCYRGQWGIAQRCEGWQSPDDEDRVDGLLRCEKWLREDWEVQEELKTSWWLNTIIGRAEKANGDWQYPFHQESLFVLSIRAGWEGYHITVDGRHVASFPYRTGFVLEEATGFTVSGDIELQSVVATSLPSSHPNFSPEFVVEEAEKWRAPKLLRSSVRLFIGILSSSTHFAERMAVRKTWMQSKSIRLSDVVARFFVGLHGSKDINIQVRKEADLFGDMVILPFIDHYELVVLKTVAICDYGIRNVSARHIMKTDDDTFVRVETILDAVKEHQNEGGLYMGNINRFHKPLRLGKWAVTYEEWPEEDYPPYANGPGYIISVDLAKFIVSLYEKGTLRLFKMEDVSMGLWVVQFNHSHPINYVHSLRFCQWGCVDDYYIAHYQSPRQMFCLWEKLSQGDPECCNM
ncbi:hypothetical protein O6H91_04G024400 [Diphasiastrum complanatum]|uniref:Uncharacterized protein n=3 Tax=Diphasiastrum complanatum TaxID=34168 RepID=A0ACC2DV23_DIPCM|nr:hypothetical protein O6H91_04G024400 [Diphasiastrum complanatum]KAJ7558080.1 hypothetical protein O6H91_04G024400 [Diphasiastrum complanatum]KAJ7558081.1 hypothetical protein O6H91_04G024400 [Diphasiastrum complanatum]